MKTIKCDTCGGDVIINHEKAMATCRFCGNKMYLENPNKTKETITRVIIEDNTKSAPESVIVEALPTPIPVKKRGCLGTGGLVLLWLMFWPIMIFILIFRNKEWSMLKRFVIAAVVFVMMMTISQCSSAQEIVGTVDRLSLLCV